MVCESATHSCSFVGHQMLWGMDIFRALIDSCVSDNKMFQANLQVRMGSRFFLRPDKAGNMSARTQHFCFQGAEQRVGKFFLGSFATLFQNEMSWLGLLAICARKMEKWENCFVYKDAKLVCSFARMFYKRIVCAGVEEQIHSRRKRQKFVQGKPKSGL